jgi:hypothetical protein
MWIFAAVLFSGEPDVIDMLVARGMPAPAQPVEEK